jgi:hypothetical protein
MKTDNLKNESYVAFLDLLGFRNQVNEDKDGAIKRLNKYTDVLGFKAYWDSERACETELQETANTISINSFKQFIPFSDSIFIVSDDINLFIKQLSSFLCDCFDDTTLADLNNKGSLYPIIFRGGIAYDNVSCVDTLSVNEGAYEHRKNLAGKAVVNAVGLEQKNIKGPRIIFKKDVYKSLSRAVKKKYVRQMQDKEYYELLWPAAVDCTSNPDVTKYSEIFERAVKLWKHYNHTSCAEHYWNLIELIVASTLQYFTAIGQGKKALSEIKRVIDEKGLSNKLSVLLAE